MRRRRPASRYIGTVMAWVYFLFVQIVSLADERSIKDKRAIDRWSWRPLNVLYGNPEDGVSGQYALIWVNSVLSPYMPHASAAWRAYCWSAWRNSCDNLKYIFAWKAGPFAQWTLFGRQQHIGWKLENGYNVPVISL